MSTRLAAACIAALMVAILAPATATAAPRENVDLLTGFDLRIDGAAAGNETGLSAVGAGDVNDDGIDDMIVGAHRAVNGGADSGSSYVIYGSASRNADIDLRTLATADGFRIDGAADDESGLPVAGAGDVNADGIDDLVIGAQGAGNNSREASGSSYVVYGTSTDRTANIDLSTLAAADGYRIDGADIGDRAGISVAAAGDVNDDGTDDLIIGAYFASRNGRTSSGSSYVIYGTTTNRTANIDLRALTTTDGYRIDGAAGGDQSGTSVSGAGDINADGTDDLIIGAPEAGNNGRNSSGSSYVIYGTTTNRAANIDLDALAITEGFRIDGAVGIVGGDQSGTSVAGAGDVNDDGTDDLIVGSLAADNNNRNSSGSSYVIYGTTTDRTANIDLDTLATADGFRIDGAAELDLSGYSVAGAGDINADGIDDLIIGAYLANVSGRGDAGSSYVVYGSASRNADIDLATFGSTTSDGFGIDGVADQDASGRSVASAGDVNADGIDDVIIGSPRADNNTRDRSGSVYAVHGADATAPPAPQGSGATGTSPGTPPAAAAPAPVFPTITGARLSATRFAVDTRARAAATRRRGATLSYRINKPATVIHNTQRLVRGKWRTIRVFGIRYPTAGTKRLNYSGKIRPRGKERALKPGRYRLRIRASDPAGNRGTLTTLGFRIVR